MGWPDAYRLATFTPSASRFAGEPCHGVHVEVTERAAVEPVATGLALAWSLLRQHGAHFEAANVDILLRNQRAWEHLMRARSAGELAPLARDGLEEFRSARARVLLYD